MSRATAAEIDEARVRYSPVAARGAALFFCIAELAALNNMYEYSLASFQGVFNQVRSDGGGVIRWERGGADGCALSVCIQCVKLACHHLEQPGNLLCTPPPQSLNASKKEHALEARLRSLTEQLTSDVYGYVCTGLFEAHKLLFSFQLAVKVLQGGPNGVDAQVGGSGGGLSGSIGEWVGGWVMDWVTALRWIQPSVHAPASPPPVSVPGLFLQGQPVSGAPPPAAPPRLAAGPGVAGRDGADRAGRDQKGGGR